jgi:hypothetical protein
MLPNQFNRAMRNFAFKNKTILNKKTIKRKKDKNFTDQKRVAQVFLKLTLDHVVKQLILLLKYYFKLKTKLTLKK